MKTTNDILSDVYKIIKSSSIDALNGGIYKGTRPTESKLQDCVVSLISGTTAKFLQNGALYVKLFYSDIESQFSTGEKTYSEDFSVASQMETLLYNLSNTLLNTNGYSFDIESRDIHTEQIEETNEHYAVLIINFKILI